MGREVTAQRATLLTALGVFVVAGGLPVLAMILASFTTRQGFGLEAYAGLVASGRPWILFLRSLGVGLIATAWALVVGWPAGVLCERTDLPGRALLTLLLCVPFVVPTYVNAVAWARVLGDGGLLARQFVNGPSRILYSLWGSGLVLGSCFSPLVLILTRASLRNVDPRLEEAARPSAGWFAILRGITLPLAFPGTALAAGLVFLLAVGDLAVPTYLRTDVFPTESFTQFAAAYRFSTATALAMPLMLLALLVLGAESWIIPRRFASLRPFFTERDRQRIPLGRSRWPIAGLLFGISVVLVVLPVGVLVEDAMAPGALAAAWQRAGDATLRSLAWAAIGATMLTILGFLLGYLVQRRVLGIWRFADQLSLFLFATPGTVLGIGLVALWNHSWTSWIYGTPLVVLLGFLGQFVVVPSRLCGNALAAIPAHIEEAAQLAGARWPRRMVRIVLPLVAPGLAAAWLASFLFCLRDLGISMIVYPPGADTLPVRTFTLMANGSRSLVSALCVLMTGASLGPLLMLAGVLHRREPR